MTDQEHMSDFSTISREDLARETEIGAAKERRIWSLGSAAVIVVSAVGYLKDILWPHTHGQELPSGDETAADSAEETTPHLNPSDTPALETGALPKKPAAKGSGTFLKDEQGRANLLPPHGSSPGSPDDTQDGTYVPTATSNHYAVAPLAQNDNGIFDHAPPHGAPVAQPHHGTHSQGGTAGTSSSGTHSQAHEPAPQDTTKPETSSGDPPSSAGPTGPPKSNRAPTLAGPVTLSPLRMNEVAVIGIASLLAGASDADGDALSVVNLTSSSGELTDNHNGTWTFASAHDDTSDVIFTYHVSDGTDDAAQTATLDLLQVTSLPSDDHVLIGTDGNDVLAGSSSNDVIDGRGGSDIIHGGEGCDVIRAGSAGSVVDGGDGDDTLIGGDGNDVIFGGRGNDHIFGGAGDDVLIGGAGDDVIEGGTGNDNIDAGTGNNVVIGGEGDDDAISGPGSTVFKATQNDGNDHYAAKGGSGTYDMSQTSASAVIDLDAGTAQSTETGHDHLDGIHNAIGSSGDDVFIANANANIVTGGGGHDRYVFKQLSDRLSDPITLDTITDFEVGDTIDVSELGHDEGPARCSLSFGGETHEDRALIVVKDSVFYSFTSDADGDHTVVFATLSDEGGKTYFTLDLIGHHDLTRGDFAGVG